MATNKDMNTAKTNKADEFYTDLDDIVLECSHYREHFKDAVVFCNCDDPEWSNFWVYFHTNFTDLGLKKLISTHYNADGKPSYKMEYSGGNDLDVKAWSQVSLTGNGDFRSDECIDVLKEADIVVTNPPFSLFREYLLTLIKHEKKFLIIGNISSITCKDVFPLVKKNKVWLGASIHSGDRKFYVPDDYPLNAAGCGIAADGRKYIRVKGVRWYTNMDFKARHDLFFKPEDAHCYYEDNESEYLKYDNYNAINIPKTKDIPIDYDGAMGVPITFLDKYNPDEFEILGNSAELAGPITIDGKTKQNPQRFYLNEKRLFDKLVVKNKKPISKEKDLKGE